MNVLLLSAYDVAANPDGSGPPPQLIDYEGNSWARLSLITTWIAEVVLEPIHGPLRLCLDNYGRLPHLRKAAGAGITQS